MGKRSKLLSAAVLASLLTFNCTALAADEADNNIKVFTLDTLVVTASRIPQDITDAKADVSVVTRKHIEEMHMQNVEEALRTVPGVQFLNYGGNGLNANLSGIRINGSKDIVILVDGVRLTDFQGSNNSGYMYASLMSNMDNIERIEVLRGSAATIYGSGAKGGVINIITRKINKLQTTLDASTGSFGHESYKFNTQGTRNKLAWNIYYNKALTGDFEDGDGNKWEGQTDIKSSGVKFTYDFDDKNKLMVNYDKIKSDYNGQDFIYNNEYNGNYEMENLTLKYDTKITDKLSNSLTYRNSDIKTRYNQGRVTINNNDNTYNFISDQLTYITERNTLIMGLDYSKGEDNRRGYEMDNYSYYIQEDWEFIPHVTISAGVRYDDPDRSGNGAKLESHTSKSYKLSWDITDNDNIYVGRSDFYILPSMEQWYSDRWGNSSLKPAEGRTSSIGYSKKFDDYNVFTINYFKTESDQTIGLDNDGQYQNYEDGIARGWNAQYMTQIGKYWSGNIGWSHLYQYTEGDNLSMGYYPKDMATFGVTYNYAKVTAALDGYYFMRSNSNDPRTIGKKGWPSDNYGIFNLSVNYAPDKNLNFYTKVNNLFDKLYAEHTDAIHIGKPGDWYAMPGRSIIVGMQLKF